MTPEDQRAGGRLQHIFGGRDRPGGTPPHPPTFHDGNCHLVSPGKLCPHLFWLLGPHLPFRAQLSGLCPEVCSALPGAQTGQVSEPKAALPPTHQGSFPPDVLPRPCACSWALPPPGVIGALLTAPTAPRFPNQGHSIK